MALIQKLIQHLHKIEINPDKLLDIITYLKKYGYLKKEFSFEDFLAAVRLFHSFYNIDEEELNSKSLQLVERPRCGFPDILPLVTEDVKWRKKNLTYCINKYVTGLTRAEQDDIHEQVCKDWSAVCGIAFTRINGPTADIMLSTGSGQRDDFDGPSGTLAWCEIPQSNQAPVNLKFDLGETWIKSPGRGVLLKNVCQHEMGHALSLLHSQVQTSLMAPYYNINVSKPQQNDDIPRIQQLYGLPQTPPATPPVTPPTVPPTKTITINLTGDFEIDIPGFRLLKTS